MLGSLCRRDGKLRHTLIRLSGERTDEGLKGCDELRHLPLKFADAAVEVGVCDGGCGGRRRYAWLAIAACATAIFGPAACDFASGEGYGYGVCGVHGDPFAPYILLAVHPPQRGGVDIRGIVINLPRHDLFETLDVEFLLSQDVREIEGGCQEVGSDGNQYRGVLVGAGPLGCPALVAVCRLFQAH